MSTIELIPRGNTFLVWTTTDSSTISQMPQQICKQIHLHTFVGRHGCTHASVYLFIIRHATQILNGIKF